MSDRIRFALQVNEEFKEMAKHLASAEDADEDSDPFSDDEYYIVVEVLEPRKFMAQILTKEETLEEYTKDPSLTIM